MIKRIRVLPQSRYYLQATQYGIDTLVEQRPMDEGFLFYASGILACLRAVQHALINRDSTQSEDHKAIIEAWNRKPQNGPEIEFIKWARDLILKEGAFEGYATRTESISQNTDDGYDAVYYRDGERRDFLQDLRAAVAWCDAELTTLETQSPAVKSPG